MKDVFSMHTLKLSLAICAGIAVARMFSSVFGPITSAVTNLTSSLTPTSSTAAPTAPCYIAAAAFEEDFFSGPRVSLVRRWLVEIFEPRGIFSRLVMALYRVHGERVGRIVARSRVLKAAARVLIFNRVLAKATAKFSA
jgi:hypothetical protein